MGKHDKISQTEKKKKKKTKKEKKNKKDKKAKKGGPRIPPVHSHTMDLTLLTSAEEKALLAVIEKDAIFLSQVEQKINLLEQEILRIRIAGALVPGDKQHKICARCKYKFWSILCPFADHGQRCINCQFKVCKVCRRRQENMTWICTLCDLQRQLRNLTGEWLHKGRCLGLYGSDLIRASLRDKDFFQALHHKKMKRHLVDSTLMGQVKENKKKKKKSKRHSYWGGGDDHSPANSMNSSAHDQEYYFDSPGGDSEDDKKKSKKDKKKKKKNDHEKEKKSKKDKKKKKLHSNKKKKDEKKKKKKKDHSRGSSKKKKNKNRNKNKSLVENNIALNNCAQFRNFSNIPNHPKHKDHRLQNDIGVGESKLLVDENSSKQTVCHNLPMNVHSPENCPLRIKHSSKKTSMQIHAESRGLKDENLSNEKREGNHTAGNENVSPMNKIYNQSPATFGQIFSEETSCAKKPGENEQTEVFNKTRDIKEHPTVGNTIPSNNLKAKKKLKSKPIKGKISKSHKGSANNVERNCHAAQYKRLIKHIWKGFFSKISPKQTLSSKDMPCDFSGYVTPHSSQAHTDFFRNCNQHHVFKSCGQMNLLVSSKNKEKRAHVDLSLFNHSSSCCQHQFRSRFTHCPSHLLHNHLKSSLQDCQKENISSIFEDGKAGDGRDININFQPAARRKKKAKPKPVTKVSQPKPQGETAKKQMATSNYFEFMKELRPQMSSQTTGPSYKESKTLSEMKDEALLLPSTDVEDEDDMWIPQYEPLSQPSAPLNPGHVVTKTDISRSESENNVKAQKLYDNEREKSMEDVVMTPQLPISSSPSRALKRGISKESQTYAQHKQHNLWCCRFSLEWP